MVAQVVITVDGEGRLGIQTGGPALTSKWAILGLLDEARNAILNQQAKEAPPILLARGALPNGKG